MFLAPSPAELTGTLRYISNGTPGILQTLAVMRELVHEGRRNLDIRQTAVQLTWNTPQKDAIAEVRALFEFVRDHIRYTADILDVETIAAPWITLALQYGDCDDQVTLLCSLFESIGYATRFVVAGYNDARTYEHVYCEVCADGLWLACDPTEPNALGWEAPGALITHTEKV